MRITVDIEESVLNDLLEITGDKAKSPAVARAVTEYVRRIKAKEFGQLIREGAFDYPDPDADFAPDHSTYPIAPLHR